MRDIKSPSVSVCIPVFNGAAFIRECIQSVLSQGFEDFELLIVDNKSTDNTIEICSAFSDPRIRIHRGTANIGAHRNFKKCFELALGELVMLLPCDDLLEPNGLAALAAPLIENTQAGLAFGRTKVINGAGDILSEACFTESGLLSQNQALNCITDNFNPIQHPLVRRSSYFQHRGFQKKYGCYMDIHLWVRIALSSKWIYLASQSTTCIRQHPAQGQQIMSNMSANNLASVANHFGVRSLKQHQYRSGVNLCFLRFARFLVRLDAERDAPTGNGIKMLSKLIKSNIHKLAKSFIYLDRSQANLELVVARRIFSQFNKSLILTIYVKEMLSLLGDLSRKVFAHKAIAASRNNSPQQMKP